MKPTSLTPACIPDLVPLDTYIRQRTTADIFGQPYTALGGVRGPLAMCGRAASVAQRQSLVV